MCSRRAGASVFFLTTVSSAVWLSLGLIRCSINMGWIVDFQMSSRIISRVQREPKSSSKRALPMPRGMQQKELKRWKSGWCWTWGGILGLSSSFWRRLLCSEKLWKQEAKPLVHVWYYATRNVSCHQGLGTEHVPAGCSEADHLAGSVLQSMPWRCTGSSPSHSQTLPMQHQGS